MKLLRLHNPASAGRHALLLCALVLAGLTAGSLHDLVPAHDAQHECVVCSVADRPAGPLPHLVAIATVTTPVRFAVPVIAPAPPPAPRTLRPAPRAPPAP